MSRSRPSALVLSVVVAAVCASGCAGTYVRATDDEVVPSTPERVARGSYLVNQAMSCGACHTPRAGGSLLSGERSDAYLAGTAFALPSRGIKVWIPNLTSDVETGLGAWSDDEIMRAIRDGVGKDAHFMFPLMPFTSYAHLSDEDVRAVVAYLRTVPPVASDRTPAKNELGVVFQFMLDRGMVAHRPAREVPPPPRAAQDPVKYGEYVLRLGHCAECHAATATGPRDVGGEGFLSGSDRAQEYPGVGKVYARNLTPDRKTGLGMYTAAQLKQALRDGKRLDGKPMAIPMSLFVPHLSGLSEPDLDALVAFLRAVPAYANQIPERVLLPAYEKALSGP